MPAYSLREPSVLAFVILPVLLALAFIAGVRAAWRRAGEPPAAVARATTAAAIGCAVWMGVTWLAAERGTFREWERVPPSLVVLVVLIVMLAARLAMGGVGRRFAAHLPLWVLVGVQGFRLPLELVMHRMYGRGIMPEQMSYSGRNFDIVSGALALIVAALVARGAGGRLLVAAWNLLGLALLLNIVVIAILSTPLVAYFGEDRLNVWVTYPPFVWLPAVLVLAALTGHLIIFRAVSQAGRPSVSRLRTPH